MLSGWARHTRPVPKTLLDGPLVVEEASVVRMEVARLLETRTEPETPTRIPGRLGQLPTYEDLWQHRLDGEEWQERDWHGVRKGSVKETVCVTCGGQASRRCGTCQGRRRAGAARHLSRLSRQQVAVVPALQGRRHPRLHERILYGGAG